MLLVLVARLFVAFVSTWFCARAATGGSGTRLRHRRKNDSRRRNMCRPIEYVDSIKSWNSPSFFRCVQKNFLRPKLFVSCASCASFKWNPLAFGFHSIDTARKRIVWYALGNVRTHYGTFEYLHATRVMAAEKRCAAMFYDDKRYRDTSIPETLHFHSMSQCDADTACLVCSIRQQHLDSTFPPVPNSHRLCLA